MAQKEIVLPGVGPILLSKRKGSRNIRLSINAKGQVRVGMPKWTPYSAGLTFAFQKKDWILSQLDHHKQILLTDGVSIGKSHRLNFEKTAKAQLTSLVKNRQILIRSNADWASPAVQLKAVAASERALKLESQQLLERRLETLSSKTGYSYNSLKIKKLTGRWGSCSNRKVITLSIYLIQLPWDLIDYVLIHELIHTRHLNHGQDFWMAFKQAIPDARLRQKSIRQYKPQILPVLY